MRSRHKSSFLHLLGGGRRRRSLVAAFVASAVLFGAFTYWVWNKGNPGGMSDSNMAVDIGQTSRAETTETVFNTGADAVMARASVGGHVDFVFKSAENEPVPQVTLWKLPLKGRLHPASNVMLIGQGDSNGTARIEAIPQAMTGDSAIVARAPGSVSVDVTQMVSVPGQHIVTLTHAEHLRVRCIDVDGQPVAGVRIVASLEYLERERIDFEDPSLDGTLPGSDSISAIFVRTTGPDGATILDSLPSGLLSVSAIAMHRPDLVILDGPRRVSLPGTSEVVYTFGRLFAAIVNVTGDTVVAWKLRNRDSRGLPVAVSPHARVDDAVLRLRARYPDAILSVVAPLSGVAPIVKCQLLLENAGFHDIDVVASPLIEPPIVTTVDAASFPRSANSCADVMIRVIDETGRALKTTAPWSFEFQPPGSVYVPMDGLFSKVRLGTWQRLPEGTYHVTSFSNVISTRLRTKAFEVEADSSRTIDIVVAGEWARCIIKVIDERGDAIPMCATMLQMQGGGSEFLTMTSGEREITLPVGKGSVKLMPDVAYEASESSFDVKPCNDGSVQEIIVKARRGRN